MEVKKADHVNICLPAKPEYVGVIRLTISAIANRMGFDIEEIEDIKVCVSEACTNSIKHSKSENFDIKVVVGTQEMIIEILDEGQGFDVEKLQNPDLDQPKEEGGLGIFIIKSLMDEVDINSTVGQGSMIRMVKYLGEN